MGLEWGTVIGAGVGAVGNILSANYNNEKAKEREREARAENYAYNEKAAENADKRTRMLYNDLYSPKAQMQQAVEAGLSPSIYASGGMAGKQGQSGAQGGGSEGVMPNVYGINPINAALMAAQVNRTKAETANIEADTANKEGTGAQGKADIAKKLAEAGLTKASQAYTKAQTIYTELLNTITEETGMSKAQAEIKQIDALTTKAVADAKLAGWQVDFNELTKHLQVDQLTNQNALLVAQKLAEESKVQLNEAQINFMQEEIKNWAVQNGLKYLEIEVADTHNRNMEDIYYEQNKISWEDLWQRNTLKLKELGLKEEEIKTISENAKRYAWLNFATDMANVAVRAGALAYTKGLSEIKPFQQTTTTQTFNKRGQLQGTVQTNTKRVGL